MAEKVREVLLDAVRDAVGRLAADRAADTLATVVAIPERMAATPPCIVFDTGATVCKALDATLRSTLVAEVRAEVCKAAADGAAMPLAALGRGVVARVPDVLPDAARPVWDRGETVAELGADAAAARAADALGETWAEPCADAAPARVAVVRAIVVAIPERMAAMPPCAAVAMGAEVEAKPDATAPSTLDANVGTEVCTVPLDGAAISRAAVVRGVAARLLDVLLVVPRPAEDFGEIEATACAADAALRLAEVRATVLASPDRIAAAPAVAARLIGAETVARPAEIACAHRPANDFGEVATMPLDGLATPLAIAAREVSETVPAALPDASRAICERGETVPEPAGDDAAARFADALAMVLASPDRIAATPLFVVLAMGAKIAAMPLDGAAMFRAIEVRDVLARLLDGVADAVRVAARRGAAETEPGRIVPAPRLA